MLLAPENFAQGHVERGDVCVLGTGPAGMSLAQSLAERGVSVVLIEAGDWDWTPESQDMMIGTWEGDDPYPLDSARLRQFGGTSGHWEGFSRPLDPQDFITRANYDNYSWPITDDAIAPYLERACEILEVPATFGPVDLGSGLERITFQQSPPTRFGEVYRDYVQTNENIHIALNSPAVDIIPDGEGGIRAAQIQTLNGPSWQVEAQYFVLCAGGIENARLLKWFNERNDRALIANHDLIGRYWMEHPYPTVGEAVLWNRRDDALDDSGRGFFKLSQTVQEELGVLSGAFGVFPDAYGSNRVLNMIADLMCVAPGLGQHVMDMRNRALVCGARVLLQAEQAPQAENRVDFGPETDALGIPQLVMHWRRTEIDRRIIAESTLRFGELLAENDIGRMRVPDWITDDSVPLPTGGNLGAYHHLGGTRMSDSPETGIVDADCRVHDLNNFYIGGSSIFPTGGLSNPTLPIVQFALRLGDHLEARLRAL